MYLTILFIALGIAWLIVRTGVARHSRNIIAAGIGLGLAELIFFGLLGFWGEVLWFAELGQSRRLWTEVLTRGFAALAGAAVAGAIVFFISKNAERTGRQFATGAALLFGGLWGLSSWQIILQFINRLAAGLTEPLLNLDAGFYLFSLPFYTSIYSLLALIVSLGIVTLLYSFFLPQKTIDHREEYLPAPELFSALYRAAGILLLILALGKWLNRFHLLFSQWGVVSGPGWVDTHVRLPAYTIIALITALLGMALLIPAARKTLIGAAHRFSIRLGDPRIDGMVFTATAMLLIWFLGLAVLPGLFQALTVVPNEITLERQYLANSIKFTRFGFDLEKVERHQYPAEEKFDDTVVKNNRPLFDNIRLWDWRALLAVYGQFQEIRLYYQFSDVDVDRYAYDNQYRQVMVGGREMNIDNLPDVSQTFVNRHFKYTHGFGITLAPVHDFTPSGLPDMLVKNIPPESVHPALQIQQPRIYFGEMTNAYCIGNSQVEEFDYPKGAENVYTRYDGSGGVPISNFWRKFLFGWKFGGTQLLFSSYPYEKSRILFHREIRERVKLLCPFLQLDNDPYIVLAGGRLYWIIDCYTTSGNFPYSEVFFSQERTQPEELARDIQMIPSHAKERFRGINYMRNSVKAVIDAFNGSVDLYVFEEKDPLIRVWSKAFPGLFKPREQMPPELQAHARYPSDYLLAQGLIYAKYHMTDPEVFYNQEDLWIRATEKYYDQVQPVEPYYIMWRPPLAKELEFVQILPFTPKNRQVLIGWIAGMCDGPNYGRFLAYQFPKEKRVLGTQQFETKIDQDGFLSAQMSLWNRRGSTVIRGNILVIPVETTLVYVEPIFLQAETAAYPELRLVVMMHGDDISYAENFEKALAGLVERRKPSGMPEIPGAAPGERPGTFREASPAQQANDAFNNYLRMLGERRFDEAGRALKDLEQALKRLLK